MAKAGRASIVAVVIAFSLLLAGGAGGQAPTPGTPPPGANDFSCKPSKGHTRPVVLVHGTGGDMTFSWNLISPALVERGYCVFALDYGGRGTGRIQDSAAELKAFVERVLRATDARKVAIVGHSQGGMMPRHYMRFLGGADQVAELIGLVPSNHGTTNPGALLVPNCPACRQQAAGSPFMKQLNRGDETPGKRVSFTQITTRYDEVVTPYQSAFLKGPKTTDVVVQDKCPGDTTEHVGIIYDPVALQWVQDALRRQGKPADPGFQPTC